nr:retrovirus-related Pol polyprotein from transposon TNT 1-94 [Tanacetum cinerariifolium]
MITYSMGRPDPHTIIGLLANTGPRPKEVKEAVTKKLKALKNQQHALDNLALELKSLEKQQLASSGQAQETEIAEQLSKSKEDLEYIRKGDTTETDDKRNSLRTEIKENIAAAVASRKDFEDQLYFNVEVEEQSLEDKGKPASYKAALSNLEFEKWLVAMNVEIQSMYDNKVWKLVDLPHGAKVVKSKWIDKKKTDMDGVVYIYKARLVAKDEEIYMEQPEGFVNLDHPRKASGSNIIFLILYVDDIILMGNHKPSLQEVKDYLGSIMYAVRCTRPDVAFTQNITSRFHQSPSEAHWTAVKNILKYLRRTKDMFLVYGGNSDAELQVKCYCNAGFETDRDDTKSQTRYVFTLNGGTIVWKSSKQSTTAQHATEAE